MKRWIPLLVTAASGLTLVAAHFVPSAESWGDKVAIWFDVLASIAFVLGGGNLLKVHLQKTSDRSAGWGYSVVTLLAFFATLGIGLPKLGTRPAGNQQFFGENFAPLELDDFPQDQKFEVPGTLPDRPGLAPLPLSVKRQLSAADGKLVFRGWMLPNQRNDLLDWDDTLAWRCAVETLFREAQPPAPLRAQVSYHANHRALGFKGVMSQETKQELDKLSENAAWRAAVASLERRSHHVTETSVGPLPPGLDAEKLPRHVTYDAARTVLKVEGPLSKGTAGALANVFPLVRPMGPEQLAGLERELAAKGNALDERQQRELKKLAAGTWTTAQLRSVLDEAGNVGETARTNCRMLEDLEAKREVRDKEEVGPATKLSAEQVALLQKFAEDPRQTTAELSTALAAAGTFPERQAEALDRFFQSVPTVGEWRRRAYFALLREGPLTEGQRDVLLTETRRELAWRQAVARLVTAAHDPKYPWSGEYNEPGTPFWWIYEYVFKPLTATMFAMLAFYVASAAFRAFRAKNLEATLLLATAFLILLGRTAAGTMLTSWIPEDLDALRIDGMTLYVMKLILTAGNRAILIGVALGIVSTSLRILLGIDRSYLGSEE